MTYSGENIWIIGASSGIGRTLSLELAKSGANLILSARRKDALQKLAQEIAATAKEVQTTILPCDVSKKTDVAAVFKKLAGKRIDRIIFMAAIYTPPGDIKNIDIDKARQIMDVNLIGALSVSQYAIKHFAKQTSGQLALCASVAGYIGLPRGQIYSASKAAMINLAESLYAEAPKGVDIKIINPGFVETAMTNKNDFHMPMIITPEKAAIAIARGLTSSSFDIHFPKKFTWLMKLLQLLPYRLSLAVSRKIRP